MNCDLAVVGGGPAGLTAALYALRAGLSVVVFEKNVYGGQMAITPIVENYPGIVNVRGFELSKLMYDQVLKLGCRFVFEEVKSVNLKGENKSLKSGKTEVGCRTVILANGLKRRSLGCKGEQEFAGRGVSYCATCDGSLFRGKDVAVVGGGNTAVEDAIYLSNICSRVTIILRRDKFRAEKHLQDALLKKINVNIVYNSEIKEISGDKFVTSVAVRNKIGIVKNFSVQGVFIAIGYQPDNEIYKNQVNIDQDGYFITDEFCNTNLSGVFVAGDSRIKPLRQIVTAVSDGAIAATAAVRYIG